MKRLVLLALLAAAPAAAQTATWATRAGDLKLEPRVFAMAAGDSVAGEEGWLAVPEVRGRAGTRLIDVHFVRVRGTAADPGPPLVYLAGGPGNLGTGAARSPDALEAWRGALERMDLIMVDQRGTRDAALRWSWDGPAPPDFFTDAAAARAHWADMSRRALEAFRARGVDIAGYTTLENAEDIEDLRLALGVPRISLLCFSYGTHLGLAYLRRHDAHVASAVMVGVEGPDHTFKLPSFMDTQFRKLALLAAADSAVGRDVPDLVALLDRVDAKLAARPMVVHVPDASGGTRDVAVGPFGLHLILRADIGDASDLPVFPRLLDGIDRGDPSVLEWFVRKRYGWAAGVHGMGIHMDAASGASPARLETIRAEAATSRFGDVVNFPFPEIGPIWCPEPAGAAFHAPVVSAVRTLFLSGALDWNAPPQQAEEMRWGFPNSTHIVVANAGHEQTLWQNPDAVPVVVDFLAGRDVSGRALAWHPLRFIPLRGTDPANTHPALSAR